MGFSRFFILPLSLMVLVSAWPDSAPARQQCAQLFAPADFPIQIGGRRTSQAFLRSAHQSLTSGFEISQVNRVLKQVKNSGLDSLNRDQRKLIVKFRQNTSFMRSIFQTADQAHRSPREFARFVRDFGVLKDLVLMNDAAGSRDMAKKILRDYSELDFDALLNDARPASKKSVRRYFREILNDTEVILAKNSMTVDEVHDIRKNLRDVLRYLQIRNQVRMGTERPEDTPQITYLKRINADLGRICDENAARMLRGEITEHTVVRFPEDIRPRVEYFLRNYTIVVD